MPSSDRSAPQLTTRPTAGVPVRRGGRGEARGRDGRHRARVADMRSREANGVATVVLADDHPVVRRGLRSLLSTQGDVDVVGEAGDVETAVRKVFAYRPSLLLLDLSMPGGSSLEAIPRILERSPETAIVVLTMYDDPALARSALRAGALGFVLKDSADSELQDALHAALRGDPYLTPRLGARLAREPEPRPGVWPDGLSDREVQVLRLLALGHSRCEIAARLAVNSRTVESHRANVLRKLGLRTRAELVAYAREHHLFG